MIYPEPSFSVNVDVTNPGQFFACCGLLELAHRLWPDAEGWFDISKSIFIISCKGHKVTVDNLIQELSLCMISGLTKEERRERENLEAERRRLKKEKNILPQIMEKRLTDLGAMARKGAICLGPPFDVVLNWWQTDEEDTGTPKTWAGLQELHKVARAAQSALANVSNPMELLNYGCVLRMPPEYCKKKADCKKSVEPFYFDARRFAHALDAGFSLDVQEAETIAHPAVELLSLIGLQRFRPVITEKKWAFKYSIWSTPLSLQVAAVAACCAIPAGQQFFFQLMFRDDKKRYKAFGLAIPIGGQI